MAQIVIVGAGPAGLYAGCMALVQGHAVTIVEKNQQAGKKLLITGKGRCNLTNQCDEAEFLKHVRHNPRFLYSAIHALPPAALMQQFEQWGLPLKIERGRRVFPASDRAEDVLETLLRHLSGARMLRGRVVELLFGPDNRVTGVRLDNQQVVDADAVIVATGGVSYPTTGSTGDGYKLAEQAGHTIVPPVPSLVSLVARGGDCREMTGLSLRNVELSLFQNRKLVFREQGEMLFTHFGLSGPLVLSASAYIENPQNQDYLAAIDLKPALSPEKLDARLQRDFADFANREALHCLDKLLPSSMRPVMFRRWGVEPQRRVNQITRAERLELGRLVKRFEVEIAGRGDLAHAVVTAGGVDVKQVDPKTMQSKLAQGLYFAGEVLDVDGYTGGYNLQIAWATAAAAARNIS